MTEPVRAMTEPAGKTTDPVCGMTVDTASAAAQRTVAGRTYWFCSSGCADAFDAHQGVPGPVR